MKRFDRLEFENKQVTPLATSTEYAQQAENDRDSHHWLHVAVDERRNGQHENALRHYSRALELDKAPVNGWVGQVQMLIALGENPEAELWARKALELFKNNPDLLAARAQALCRTGDLKSAQASCDAAIGQQGLSSYPWVARGGIDAGPEGGFGRILLRQSHTTGFGLVDSAGDRRDLSASWPDDPRAFAYAPGR